MRVAATLTGNPAVIQELLGQLVDRCQMACDHQAKRLQADAKTLAPKATGSLGESIYVNSADGWNDYSQRTGAAKGADPSAEMLSMLPAPAKPGATVGVAARHGAPINDGFDQARTGNHIPAQPFWTIAVEENARLFPGTVMAFVMGGTPV